MGHVGIPVGSSLTIFFKEKYGYKLCFLSAGRPGRAADGGALACRWSFKTKLNDATVTQGVMDAVHARSTQEARGISAKVRTRFSHAVVGHNGL